MIFDKIMIAVFVALIIFGTVNANLPSKSDKSTEDKDEE